MHLGCVDFSVHRMVGWGLEKSEAVPAQPKDRTERPLLPRWTELGKG